MFLSDFTLLLVELQIIIGALFPKNRRVDTKKKSCIINKVWQKGTKLKIFVYFMDYFFYYSHL